MGGAHPSFGGCHRPWPYTRSRVARDFRPSRACYRLGLDGYLRLLEALTSEIRQVTQTIESQVQANPQAHLLRTMPGIGAYSALLILSEIGDVHRFPDSRHLCSYAGLVPSVPASGGKTRLGRLTKHGSTWLRWILVELSLHAINGAPQFRSLYARVAKQHGNTVGRVAVARARRKTIDAMLKRQEAFRPLVQGITGQRPGVMAGSSVRRRQAQVPDCATGVPVPPVPLSTQT